MNEQTFNRRLYELVVNVNNHPNRNELLQLMAEQVAEDTEIVTL